MLQLQVIRQNPEWVKERLAIKLFYEVDLIDKIIKLDDQRKKLQLEKNALPHWEIAKKYDIIDFELGNKITGSGFPVYKNKGAKLQRALIQYFLDYNLAAGYTEYLPPLMVNETTAFGTGQLPD